MGLTEDINALNTRIASLTRKQEEASKALAISEHQISELATKLKAAGYDVAKMVDEDIDHLIESLSEQITVEIEKITKAVESAENQFEKFKSLK